MIRNLIWQFISNVLIIKCIQQKRLTPLVASILKTHQMEKNMTTTCSFI